MTRWGKSKRRWITTTRPCRIERAVGDRSGEAATLNNIGLSL